MTSNKRALKSAAPSKSVAARLAQLAGKTVPDLGALQHALKVAELTELPEAAMERKMVCEAWHEMHALRQKGISFRQIATLLRESGYSIPRRDLEIIYSELICERWERCIEEVEGMVEAGRAQRGACS